MLSGLKSGGGGWGLCARSYTHLAYISPTRTHPRGWIVHERAGQTRTKRLYAGAARLDTFSLSVSSYQRNDHSPAPPNQARTRWTERERERENRQSVAGCIRHPERRGGGRRGERERERCVLLKRRPVWWGAPSPSPSSSSSRIASAHGYF